MLRYYIQPKRKMRPSKRTVRFETQPGYQLQHDWGEVEVEVAGQRCKVNFAVNSLGFSRRFHVFAAPKQDAEHTPEQEHLQPLPDTDFDTSYFDIRHVSWDSYIEVGGNRYSVPEALCGQPVSIRISLDDELRIYSNEKLVASHRLCSASSGWQTVPEHHAPLWQQVSQVEHRPLSAYEELL